MEEKIEKEMRVVETFKKNPDLSIESLARLTGISSSSVQRYLRKHSFEKIEKEEKTIEERLKQNKKEGNRLYKSESNDNVIRNYFYLSQKIDNKEIPNYQAHYTNNNRYFDKKRTDITDNSILEKYNNKQGFVDYQNKIIEFQNENRKISEDKKNKQIYTIHANKKVLLPTELDPI